MSQVILNVDKRSNVGTKIDELRADDIIPAVLYGKGIENQNLQLPIKAFKAAYKEAGASCLIDLSVAGDTAVKVLVKAVDYDVLTDEVTHVDFFQVKMNESVVAKIDLVFEGKSKAVTEKGGVLITKLDRLEIKCLPEKLIKDVSVDISVLQDINSSIKIGDITLPEGVEFVRNPKEVVISIGKSRRSSIAKSAEVKTGAEDGKVEVTDEKAKA